MEYFKFNITSRLIAIIAMASIPSFTFAEGSLTLEVNRATGEVIIKNTGTQILANEVNIDGYTISSEGNALNPTDGNWSSLDDQNVGGVGVWSESNPSTERLSELQASGSTLIAGQSSFSLGGAYYLTAFGQGSDLAFEYTEPSGAVVTGVVDYLGVNMNTLLLRVDPTTGEAEVINVSQFAVAIDGYTITSGNNALLTTWSSLDDQNIGGGDWLEANPSTGRLSELKEAGTLTLNSGDSFNLGVLYATGIGGGLEFEFLVNQEFLAGDFDEDEDVDGADFLLWQQGFDTTFNASNLIDWENNFGSSGGGIGAFSIPMAGTVEFDTFSTSIASTSTVPEPTCAVLGFMAFLVGTATMRCRP